MHNLIFKTFQFSKLSEKSVPTFYMAEFSKIFKTLRKHLFYSIILYFYILLDLPISEISELCSNAMENLQGVYLSTDSQEFTILSYKFCFNKTS